MTYRSAWMTEELDQFRDPFRNFLAKELAPQAEKWRKQKMVDRSAWRALGEMGALLPSVPEAYGGIGATFAYEAAVIEDLESDRARDDGRRLGAQRHRRALHPELRLRGAEAALAAGDGDGRVDRRHRHDRAGHRLRPARRADHARSGRATPM